MVLLQRASVPFLNDCGSSDRLFWYLVVFSQSQDYEKFLKNALIWGAKTYYSELSLFRALYKDFIGWFYSDILIWIAHTRREFGILYTVYDWLPKPSRNPMTVNTKHLYSNNAYSLTWKNRESLKHVLKTTSIHVWCSYDELPRYFRTVRGFSTLCLSCKLSNKLNITMIKWLLWLN